MAQSQHWTDKLHTFDWGFSLTNENVFTVFLGIVFVTLLGIGDQNFVQRVQCGNSLHPLLLEGGRSVIVRQVAAVIPSFHKRK